MNLAEARKRLERKRKYQAASLKKEEVQAKRRATELRHCEDICGLFDIILNSKRFSRREIFLDSLNSKTITVTVWHAARIDRSRLPRTFMGRKVKLEKYYPSLF